MSDQIVPFNTPLWWISLAAIACARGMDFLSTFVATPNLVLEANPIAKRVGWRGGLVVNGLITVVVAFWTLPAIIIVTTSLLVAARNFQGAWLMRTMGEDAYRAWMARHLSNAPVLLVLGCILGQSSLVAMIGFLLLAFGESRLMPLGVGMGMITYSLAILVFSCLSLWRMRRR